MLKTKTPRKTKEKYVSLAVVVYNKNITLLHKDETLLKTTLFISVSDDGLSFSRKNDVNLILPNGKKEDVKNCTGFRLAAFGDSVYMTYIRGSKAKHTVVVAKSTDMVDFRVVGGSEKIKGPLAIVPLYKFRNYFLGYFGQDNIHAADSEDLNKWNISDELISPRKDRFDEAKLHIIDNVTTDRGILVFYGSEDLHKKDTIKVNIGAAIFSLTHPKQLVWRSDAPIWEIDIEKRDHPLRSLGSVVFGGKIYLYWSSKRNEIFLSTVPMSFFTLETVAARGPGSLTRSEENPIITPNPAHDWENVSTFNPAAIYLDEKVHLLYRAIGESGISVIGYASSKDGVRIDERLSRPVYATQPLDYKGKKVKRFSLQNISGGGWGGCEDPRMTKIGDRIYMTYVAFDGYHPPGVAVTSIDVDDFRDKKWDWSEPVLLSKPGELTKNWVVFPEKINGKFAILHSISPKVLIDYVDSLDSKETEINTYHNGNMNSKRWDNMMRGAGTPPIMTKYGWLVLYHAMDRRDPNRYKVGAMILDLRDPTKVLYRSNRPILEPVEMYENQGFKSGVVYACGAVVKDGKLMVYYGGADSVVCVATVDFDQFLDSIVSGKEQDDLVFHKLSTAESKVMFVVERSSHNPLISPTTDHPWESFAAFNWCPIQDKEKIHCVYRAMSEKAFLSKNELNVSSIGYADSTDGIDFKNRRQLIAPEESWEKFGCEDPRVTKIDDTYYIFYTALSSYPFTANGIKVAVATTKDFKKIDEKHLVTPFNAKAMVLFPEKINGKYAALLTAHTDMPPVKICLAEFDKIEDIWSKEYWDKWHSEIDDHRLVVKRKDSDQVEIGAVPIRTKSGWLVVYSHIQNYYSNNKIFGIEALLLDIDDPKKIIARTDSPILVPEETYEMFGQVQDVVFPSGSFISGHKLHIYYGATDTTCCRADVDLEDLLESIEKKPVVHRSDSNPILAPIEQNKWENKAVFNPSAIDLNGTIHLVYRAMGDNRSSVMGYASTKDGIRVDERLDQPIYVPRESFELAANGGVLGFGCEDPRITEVGDSLYMFYTAYDGMNPPMVAATSIKTEDFLNKRWNWAKPAVISPFDVDDKDACLFPEEVNGRHMVFHRAHNHICLDPIKSLNFEFDKIESFTPIIGPRPGMWDGRKVGISAPPLKTDYGWLLFYHGVSDEGTYRVGAVLLSLDDPSTVLSRTTGYIFSPETPYEKMGQVHDVVFPCGVVERSGTLFIYYGGGDQVVGVATADLQVVESTVLFFEIGQASSCIIIDMNLKDEIKAFLKGDVSDTEEDLEKYSKDYSIFNVKPQIIVFPKDIDDLENLVKFAEKKKAAGEYISLTGRSAGTDMTGGPLSKGIIVSFTKYFNHIGEITDTYVKVEPGVYFRDLEKVLAAKDLLYPAFPASKDLCALGGMVNNNSGGEKTLAYGKTEDYVRELTLVMSDGKRHAIKPLSGDELKAKLDEQGFEGDIYRKLHKLIESNYDVIMKAKPDVSKNSSGYYLWNVWDKEKNVFDLTKLIVGSQGTFGLLAEAKLGLVKAKKHSRLAVIFLKDLQWAADIVEEALKFDPESIESYDDKTIGFAVKLWRQVISSMKGNVFVLAWQFLPEMLMVMRGGMPKMIMMVEITGDDERQLVSKLGKLKVDIEKFAETHSGIQVHALKNEREEQKYWTIRRQSFALLHNNTTGLDTAPFIDDFIVKPEYMAEVLPKVNAILDKYSKDLIYTIAGHPGNGNFHIIPLMNLKDERVRALIPVISEQVYKLVLQYHGSITAEHNDGLIRSPYMEMVYGKKITELFGEVKRIFDPDNIFNPGKKVNASLDYSMEHINR